MEEMKIPQAVAVIMDGNGRWAQKRGLPRTMGHAEGCRAVEKLIENAAEIGIRYLTVYAFSTENWNRSAEEVNGLMNLFRSYAGKLQKRACENNIRVRMIGDRSRFPEDIRKSIVSLEESTAGNTGMTFVMAANYGGRDELRRAAEKLLRKKAAAGLSDELSALSVTEEELSDCLDTAGMPDPDLVIRTSGEERISNFLLWQSAYAEYVFTEVLWPDFDRQELLRCMAAYSGRKRRFGGV